jgi:hypothetical protein
MRLEREMLLTGEVGRDRARKGADGMEIVGW